jgi:hypothetical protein
MTEMNNQPPEGGYQQNAYSQNAYPQNAYPQNAYAPNPYAPLTPEQRSARNMGIAGMVLGIVALVFCWLFFLSLPCGIVGLVLSIIAIRKGEKGMAIAGLICSALALLVCVIIILFTVIFVSTVSHGILNSVY